MRFSPLEWPEGGKVSPAESLATFCRLAIDVADVRVTQFVDHRHTALADHIVMPVYPLAYGLARHWWPLMAGLTGEIRLRAFREGFAVPDLRFAPDGQIVRVYVEPIKYDNPPVHFIEQAVEYCVLADLERDIRVFIETVVGRLNARGIPETGLTQRWGWIRQSLEDQAELTFCEAAGALGVDPYTCSDEEAAAIEQAVDWFATDTLGEFLAGEYRHAENVRADIEWISTQERSLGTRSELRGLADWLEDVRRNLPHHGADAPWKVGYGAAQETRKVLNQSPTEVIQDMTGLAGLCGARDFTAATARARGLRACASYLEHSPRVLLSRTRSESASLFALARAVGDIVVYAQPGRAPITDTYSHRQAVGRAFAAELLAPAEVVLDMYDDGVTVEEIASERRVDALVVRHQLENHGRFQAA